MAVTAAMVKELRESTGAGMMDCKKALTECGGDMEKAAEFLKEKGLLAAAKKTERIAAEGLVHAVVTDDGNVGVVVEVNSETDFVAKNQEFKNYVSQVADQVIVTSNTDIEVFHDEKWNADSKVTVRDALNTKISIIGEKLSIRRFDKFEKNANGKLYSYVHGGGRVVALIELVTESQSDELQEIGKNICMQIAAMNPRFVSREEVPASYIEEQKKEMTQQALDEGKPANIVEKIVQGKINKMLSDQCLLEQEYVKDSELTVDRYLVVEGKRLGSEISVSRFVRYETGEGMEKRADNFAEEVSKAING